MGTRHGAVPASEPSAEEVGLMSKSPPNGLTMIVRLPGSEPRGKLSRMPPSSNPLKCVGAGWALLVMPGRYALARQASTRSERDSKVERRVATSRGKLRESTSATSTLPLHRSCASSGSSASSSGRTSERSSQPSAPRRGDALWTDCSSRANVSAASACETPLAHATATKLPADVPTKRERAGQKRADGTSPATSRSHTPTK
mmetsp:Transcript_9809/g.32564  ORF Transcript_9809/g.32564 Transcript_9809/m.32564 type:complete len:202 (-) Transcript_9809:232-837(-)